MISFSSIAGIFSFQCEINYLPLPWRKTKFTALCSICIKPENDEFVCQKCNKFAEIKECEPCPECNPTTIVAKECTEEVTPETQSPSTFECKPCPYCNTTTIVLKECTEEITPETRSPSTFESVSCPVCAPTDTVHVTANVIIEEGTSRTQDQSPSSFECASCPESGSASTEERTLADEGTFKWQIQSSSDFLGYIGAAVLGGAFFGSFITAFVFIVLRRRTSRQKREPTSNALHNLAERDINRQSVQDHGNESRRASLKTNNKTAKGPVETTEFITEEDGVYNHLNASETVDRDEYYDHATAGAQIHSENNDDYDHAGSLFLTVSTVDDYVA
ncbi:uncharacterized protein LOC134246305 [Saccostrea cucullata]|uniref:uncharacterized protein LOC134246305 n=1 Tax=Saccostrea cuccullata TaxID=36930 RepID=UPI002ED0096C